MNAKKNESVTTSNLNIVLLPGLDGTGRLFEFLLPTLPSELKPFVVSYPTELFLDYTDLQNYAIRTIPTAESFVLLAESFSGPIALNIASTRPNKLMAVILVATFIQNPLRHLTSKMLNIIGAPLFRLPIPSGLIRNLLLGKNAPENLAKAFFDALQLVNPKVLSYRVQLVLNVDVKQALLSCSVPILYLFATEDKLVAKRNLDVMLELRPDIESISIEAPHLLLQRAPIPASQAIVNFLQRQLKFLNNYLR